MSQQRRRLRRGEHGMHSVPVLAAVVSTYVKQDELQPALDVWSGPVDEVPQFSAPHELDHIVDRELILIFDHIDEDRFAYAFGLDDAYQQFLINEDTVGYREGSLFKGKKFSASVTPGNYVVKIKSI